MTEDEEDVDAVLAGDADRFRGIALRWQGPLFNLAYRFVHDAGEAEEMTQEALLRCYRQLGRWRRDARFSTWLFALALNLYRSRLRKSRRRELAVAAELPAPIASSAATDLVAEARHAAVRQEVARLPRLYREAVVLYYFQERDVASAAAILGVPTGTLKARLHRARALLRQRLEAT